MPGRSSLDEAPSDPDDKDHEGLIAEVAEVAGVQAKSHAKRRHALLQQSLEGKTSSLIEQALAYKTGILLASRQMKSDVTSCPLNLALLLVMTHPHMMRVEERGVELKGFGHRCYVEEEGGKKDVAKRRKRKDAGRRMGLVKLGGIGGALALLLVVLRSRGLDVEIALTLLAVPLAIGASSVGHSGQTFGLGEFERFGVVRVLAGVQLGRMPEWRRACEQQRGMISLLPVHDIRDDLSRWNFAMLSKVLNGTIEKSQILSGRLGLVSTGSLYHEREDRQLYQNLFGQQNRG
ncbi:hypothetical protein M438DRAFT_358856 [Aureobasidium pullulans EXF-150]|uniref:Uncharacterized protein n=1 Tax=Aureobasidium pullulans EXF-150 TaxID=1043002 RepID=A0A074XED4_AURPU|nr:uncharacterized protein M438DRAFT_358856 [Aureobasidium pullulans EXF-150]KEQ80407.1 hypothetical protein M438DRAFT_358856 [Aureobasidium pullulans EXF-150]